MSGNDKGNGIRSFVRPTQRSLLSSAGATSSRPSVANSGSLPSTGGQPLRRMVTAAGQCAFKKRPADGAAAEGDLKRQQAPSPGHPLGAPPQNGGVGIKVSMEPSADLNSAGTSAPKNNTGALPGASQVQPRKEMENARKPSMTDSLVRNNILNKLGDGAANQRLAGLAERFVTRARTSRAARTWDSYDPFTVKWIAFCAETGEDPVAGSGVAASLFLQEIMEEAEQLGNGPQAVTKASAALTALHSLAGSVSPSSDPLCGVVREVAKRSLVAQPLNREPISVSELKRLVDTHIGPETALQTRMYTTFAVLCFKGLFRYSDLARVMVHEQLMEFSEGKVVIYLYASKTDQHGDGNRVTIFEEADSSPYCAVRLLKQLLVAGQYKTRPATRTVVGADGANRTEEMEDVGPLMRAVKAVKGTHVLAQIAVPLPGVIPAVSYTTFRKKLLQLCTAAGITKKLGTHSFRSGGASAAVNGGADPRLVQEHGRWRSTAVFTECYVHDADERKIAAQACMGLGDTD